MGETAASLKMMVFDGFGKELVEKADAADKKIHDYKGQTKAFLKAEKEIDAVTQEVSKLSKSEELSVDEAKLIVKYLMQAAKKCHELSEQTARSSITQEGKAAGLMIAAKEAKEKYDKAEQDLIKFRETKTFVNIDGPGSPRPVGTHPGPSLKTQRQAEKAAEEVEKKKKEKEKPKKTRKPAAKKTRAKKPAKSD